MNGIILASGSMECADMFHASDYLCYDPFVYVEVGGRRILAAYGLDLDRARTQSGADVVWDYEECMEEPAGQRVVADGAPWFAAAVVGAAQRAGLTTTTVPDWFPTAYSDALRAAGVEVSVDALVIRDRRRTKTPAEVRAIEECLRVCEESLELIRGRLRKATVSGDGGLLLAGTPLTSERLQGEVRAFWATRNCEGLVPVIAGGPQGAEVFAPGHGPLFAGQPILCDLFPRHSNTRFHGDMTRVFCVGEPPAELLRAHDSVRRANELGRSLVRPGATGSGIYAAVCDLLHTDGYATPLDGAATGESAELSAAPFLGHGLGLDIHEDWYGLGPEHDEPLREGDVITVEPELYRVGWGCVRLEDVVLVTADGCRTLTSFDYDLL